MTPIQLAAERLRRKYQLEITSDKEAFINCTDTIIRQVGDIGRLVDEFSAFARMPAPILKSEDITKICHDSIILFDNAHREISFKCIVEVDRINLSCDVRQIGQALTNLLQNAVDSIEEGKKQSGLANYQGKVEIRVTLENETLIPMPR